MCIHSYSWYSILYIMYLLSPAAAVGRERESTWNTRQKIEEEAPYTQKLTLSYNQSNCVRVWAVLVLSRANGKTTKTEYPKKGRAHSHHKTHYFSWLYIPSHSSPLLFFYHYSFCTQVTRYIFLVSRSLLCVLMDNSRSECGSWVVFEFNFYYVFYF